jgi:DNA-binding transcriptional LysR family regulator
MMEIRHLRYFVAVAEELHFTRAAERLGIPQQPVSVQIRQLERELGAPLFHRKTRGVELTESGTLLLDDARRILDQIEQAKARVQLRAAGETGRMRLGFAGATYFQPLVPSIVRAYRERYPNVVIAPEQSSTPRLIAGLRDGEIDIAFVRRPVGDSEGLAIEALVEEPMLIVLPASHPHAREHSLPLVALAPETLILVSRSIGPGMYDEIVASCHRAGFSPRLGQEATQFASVVHLVAAGFGASLVPACIEQIRAEGVAYLRLEGETPRAPISFAFRRDDRSMVVRNFVRLARGTIPTR